MHRERRRRCAILRRRCRSPVARVRSAPARRRRGSVGRATPRPPTTRPRPGPPTRRDARARRDRPPPARSRRRGPRPPTTAAPAPLEAIALFAQAATAMLQGQRVHRDQPARKGDQARPAQLRAALRARPGVHVGAARRTTSRSPPSSAAAAIDPDHLERPDGARPAVPREGRAAQGARPPAPGACRRREYRRRRQPRRRRRFLPRPRAPAGRLRPRGAASSTPGCSAAAAPAACTCAATRELAYLVTQPERCSSRSATCYAHAASTTTRSRLYELAAEREPEQLRATRRSVVRALIGLRGRRRDAARGAADVVAPFRASADSLELLREVYQQARAATTPSRAS